MIKRYPTQCLTCNHKNTLRITLGTDIRQEHTFACAGCGEIGRVGLNLDFENWETYDLGEELKFSSPTPTIEYLENCEPSEEEGTITNLDPTFLISEKFIHQNKIFTWMEEMTKIGLINELTREKPFINDVIVGLGGQRNLREILMCFVKAFNLQSRNKQDLSEAPLKRIKVLLGAAETPSLHQAALYIAFAFIGLARKEEIPSLFNELKICKISNPREYERFRSEFFVKHFDDLLTRQVGIIGDYIRAYDQLFQTWIYAARDVSTDALGVVSSRDLQKVKMFYGNVFEELSAGFFLPACLNNIKNGRAYDTFKEMNLKTYMSSNKANRAKPFVENHNFDLLHEEFDSVIRNASHHGGMRLAKDSNHIVEYRSGDTGNWKRMPYRDYLIRSNRIMFCSMRLLALQAAVAYGIV